MYFSCGWNKRNCDCSKRAVSGQQRDEGYPELRPSGCGWGSRICVPSNPERIAGRSGSDPGLIRATSLKIKQPEGILLANTNPVMDWCFRLAGDSIDKM
jgi:hypothetical protein